MNDDDLQEELEEKLEKASKEIMRKWSKKERELPGCLKWEGPRKDERSQEEIQKLIELGQRRRMESMIEKLKDDAHESFFIKATKKLFKPFRKRKPPFFSLFGIA